MKRFLNILVPLCIFFLACSDFSDTTWLSVSGTSTLVINVPDWVLYEDSEYCYRGSVTIDKNDAVFTVKQRFFDTDWVTLPEGVVWNGHFTSSTRLEVRKVDEGATIVVRKS